MVIKKDTQKVIELKLELKDRGKEIYSSNLKVSAIVINKGGNLCIMDSRLKVLEELDLKLLLA